jgi:hypothetical protein
MSGVSNSVRNYPEVEDDEVTFVTQFSDYFGKGPAQLNLSFNTPDSRYGNPALMLWRMPCEKLGILGWEGVQRSTEEIRTCGCKYCQIGFDLILRWRVTR